MKRSSSIVILASLMFSACSHLGPSSNALLGAWELKGGPQWDCSCYSSLDFKENGKVGLTFWGGPVSGMTAGSGTYTIIDSKHVRIIQGSGATEFSYEVNGSQLLLGQDIMGASGEDVYVRSENAPR